MIFSVLLTLGLLGLILYALLQKKEFPVVGRVLPWVCAVGIYFAWAPERTADIAHWAGIGRGADLMFYVWIVVSALLILALHLKLVTQDRKLTELARAMALASAELPGVVTDEAALPNAE